MAGDTCQIVACGRSVNSSQQSVSGRYRLVNRSRDVVSCKTGLTNKKDQSTGQKKRSVYQTNSGKYFVSVLRRIDSVIGFTSTSLAPAFIAFSLSELKA